MTAIYFDGSFFLDDGHAFGKVSMELECPVLPVVGKIISVSELTNQLISKDVQNRIDDAVKFVVETITHHPADEGRSSGQYFSCSLEDVVLGSRASAQAIFEDLEALGFDCDVWGV